MSKGSNDSKAQAVDHMPGPRRGVFLDSLLFDEYAVGENVSRSGELCARQQFEEIADRFYLRCDGAQ